MSRLEPQHRRLLVLEQGVGAAVVNFALNAGIAWLLFRSAESVPLWGQQSIAGDTVATAFILPFLTALIVTRLVKAGVASSKVPRLAEPTRSRSAWTSRSSLRRGAMLGALSILLAALPVVLLFAWLGPASLDLGSFIWFKAGFAALLAAVVTPLIAWWALVEASLEEPAA